MSLFRRRPKSQGEDKGPVTPLALAIKRKGTSVTYVPTQGGSFQPVRERVDARLTITYDEDERRLPVPARLSYHQAFRTLRQETGQSMAVINASGETGAIYGVEEGKALLFTGPTLPLTYLVDLALQSDARAKDGGALALAIFLGEVEKPGVPLLVIGVNPDRTLALQDLVPSVADFSTTLNNILGSMVAANALRGLDFDPRQASRSDDVKKLEQAFHRDRVLALNLVDLVPLAASAKSYPREPVYRGIAQSTLSRSAFAVSLLTCAVTLAFAGSGEWLRRSAIRETAALERSLEERRNEVRAQLLERVNGLGSRLTLDPVSLFEAADAISQPGAKVALAATLESARLTLTVPHTRERLAPGADRRTAIAARDLEAIVRELRLPAPQGWTRSAIETPGDLNAWLVSFTAAPVERDLLDLVGVGGTTGTKPLDAARSGRAGAGEDAGALPLARR